MGAYSSSSWPLLMVCTAVLGSAAAARMTAIRGGSIATPDFTRASCHSDPCVQSLGSLLAKQNKVVKAAVKVSLLQARNASKWAARLAKGKDLSEPELAALKDCVENFGDTFDQINSSLAELKHLSTDTFKLQMSNVQTWMSAALTNENSCLDGFEDVDGGVKELVVFQVQSMCQLISSALALVNNLAATGGY